MSDERDNVLEVVERFHSAMKEQDFDTLGKMCTDDVTIVKPDGMLRRGIDEVLGMLQVTRTTGTIDAKYTDEEVKLFGNLAVYNGRYTTYGEGHNVLVSGRGMFVYIKDGDTGERKVTSGMMTKD